jgi:S1-C subfamily serine protease
VVPAREPHALHLESHERLCDNCRLGSRNSPRLWIVVALAAAAYVGAGCDRGGQESGGTVTRTVTVTQETNSSADTGGAETVPPRESVSVPKLIKQVRDGVLRIETEKCNEGWVGTGFLVGPDLIATVDHVVAGAETIALRQEGQVVDSAARVIGEDSFRDLALIRTSIPIDGHVFKLAHRHPKLGEEVGVLGYPVAAGSDLTFTRGSVSGVNRTVPTGDVQRTGLVQTDAAINGGNSGGPVFALSSGAVIGLADLKWKTVDVENVAWAVSAEVAEPVLGDWEASPQILAEPFCLNGAESSTTFSGDYFSIAYPQGWRVEAGEESKGTYLDTTITDPADESTLVRVDVNPGVGAADPMSFAKALEPDLERQAGYQRIELRRSTFQGYDSVRWEFVVRESGVLLHKVDVFFISDNGDGFALLTQTQDSMYGDSEALFDQVRASLTVQQP